MNKKIAGAESRLKNVFLVLRAVQGAGKLSRIEISETAGLSPSAVTGIVGQLIAEGILEEVGTGESTGGRRPVFVRLAPDGGCVVVVEIRRDGVSAKIFDLQREDRQSIALSSGLPRDNILFDALTDLAEDIRAGRTPFPQRLLCMGLLCQDDIAESELGVMYSTSISSATVPLEAALRSRLKLPVFTEYSERLSVYSGAKGGAAPEGGYAYVRLGRRITASVTIDGAQVSIAGRSVFDLGFLAYPDERRHGGPRDASGADPAALARAIRGLRVFFPVRTVLLGGGDGRLEDFARELGRALGNEVEVRRLVSPRDADVAKDFARELLSRSMSELSL